mmetsp:Transcript_58126/g.135907  ORF Transcript_58126/g.135907 Transcript_58126/m.135907 type:complete len:777 (+) Transcript_58126:148-2478(+)
MSTTGTTAVEGQGKRLSTGHPALKSLRRGLKPLADSKWFVAFMTLVLFLALFLGSFVIVVDFPDEPCNTVIDVLMIAITGVFLFEIFLNCVVEGASYYYSFFFLADVVGTISMIWEMSFLLGSAGTMRESTSNSSGGLLLLRTARASKVGARAGRMAKLIKVLPIINNRGKKTIGADVDEVEQDAGVMSDKLMFTLSTKVSALTVAFVIFLPLFGIFNFPEADKSTEAWADELEAEYAKAVAELQVGTAQSVVTFETAVEAMCHFYDDLGSLLSIFPYRLEGFDETIVLAGQERSIPGEMSCRRPTLNRQQNILIQAVPDCYYVRDNCNGYNEAIVYYDLKGVSQWEAGFDMLTICFVLLVMVLLTFDLSRILDFMVLKPLERMLGKYREVAAKIIEKVHELHQDETASNSGDTSGVSEILLLSKAFEKLVRLHDLALQTNVVDDKELDSMDDEGRAVIEDLMQLGEKRRQSRKSSVSGRSRRGSVDSNTSMSTQAASTLPADIAVIDSWEISLLDFSENELSMVMLFVYFDSSLGCTLRSFMALETFSRFYQAVERGYMKVPYHNFYHACDTAHTVYRLLRETNADEWVGDLGTMGIMVAALCHDLGHFGMTNAFLVDTGHEWALRYNDKSPLENMHCAQLFKLCQDPACNIFAQFSQIEFSEVRKVCVASILHTDMCHHFEMVKEFNTIYELNSDVCEAEAADPGSQRKSYGEQLLQKESMTWLKALLHFADISNPLKPFEVCQAWAMRVLEEFFKQGDEEKVCYCWVGFFICV